MRACLLIVTPLLLACGATQVFEPRETEPPTHALPAFAGKSDWRLHVFVAGHDRLAPSWLAGFDSGFAPVNAFVLEHPTEGLVVFDTGLSRRVARERQYCNCFSAPVVKYQLDRGEDLPSQMARAGLAPSKVRTVVVSHPHADHTGEVAAFPNAEVLVAKADLEWSKTRGSLVSVHRWEFEKVKGLQAVDLAGTAPYGPLKHHRTLSKDGALVLTMLPGHTPGSLALVLHLADGPVLLAGDAVPSRAFAAWALKYGRVGRVQHDQRRAFETLARIDAIARRAPHLAVLGAHEPVLPRNRADIVAHPFVRSQTPPAAAPLSAAPTTPARGSTLPPRRGTESRADLFILPAAAFAGTSGVAQGAAGGLSVHLLPCLAIEATAIASFRLAGSSRRMAATSIAARFSLEVATEVLLFATVGAGLLFIENAALAAFDEHVGVTLSAGGLWYLTDALGLRVEASASTPLTDSDFRWPPFRLVTVGAGLVLRL